ncbi:MAG: hypothetical protein IKT70_02285 [Clostridia bacterium]|nr:hypothetical protein [Clostridia bacterium]
MRTVKNSSGHTYLILAEYDKYALLYCQHYNEYIVAYGMENQLCNTIKWQQGRYFQNDQIAAINYFNEKTLEKKGETING